ncbi:hypothetical protein ACFL5V_06930 [Fibrobacterota bacterium]
MYKEESRTTMIVREAIVKAAAAGKNLSQTVTDITRKAVKEAIEKHGPDIDKIEQYSNEAAIGFIRGSRESGLKMLNFFNHAITGICQGAETFGDKASAVAKTAAENTIGIIQQTSQRSHQ